MRDITDWSTDGGEKLRDETDGCGAQTGWSWSEESSGGKANFNLPFFIKSGCVERAIVSAGGPKLSCHDEGLAKRRVNVRAVRHRGAVATAHVERPDFSNPIIKEAYKPFDDTINAVTHPYVPATWTTTRRSVLLRSKLHNRDFALQKRGCRVSKEVASSPPGSPPPPPPPLICDPLIPGVDECVAQIRAYGNVGPKTSLFYTGWGSTGAPGLGGAQARKWATKHMCDTPTVSWTGLADGEWRVAVQKAIIAPFKQRGMSQKEVEDLNVKADPYLKHMAQGFAEASKGDAYVFIPQGALPNNEWNIDSAWGGWEYPALTANEDVQRILRVDLDVSDANDPKGIPEVIWDRGRGDGKADYEPRGIRGPSLPEGLPVDQIPEGWDQGGSL